MPKQSAGILLYRKSSGILEVLLVHPGGPFWARKDDHAWSIPKGECMPDETPLEAARRELAEETGIRLEAEPLPLGQVKQPGGKTVHAWAAEQDFDPAALSSNTFEIEWPPHSGTLRRFPEVDRAGWFTIEDARRKILKGQLDLIERLSAQSRLTRW
jgi:predicted NUDIX family NTP pyrophosphohydrolase